MIRAIGSLIGPVIVVFLFWAGGFDFDKRGGTLVACVLFSLFSYAHALICPWWDDLDRRRKK